MAPLQSCPVFHSLCRPGQCLRGAVSLGGMATTQPARNEVNSKATSTVATPLAHCVCVCLCVYPGKAALSCADQAAHPARAQKASSLAFSHLMCHLSPHPVTTCLHPAVDLTAFHSLWLTSFEALTSKTN